jgi:uncharacterized protein
MKQRKRIGLVVFGVFLVCLPGVVAALAVPPAPTDIPIVDQTNTLTAEQKNALAASIAQERKETTNQIAILMIPTLGDAVLEEYSLNVARTWGIGEKDKNNGVLLLIAKDDHKLRIEIGYGLEGALTDARSSQIIRNEIAPLFNQGKYYEGIAAGLNGIILAIHNEYDATLANAPQQKKGVPFEVLFYILFFIPLWLSSVLARSKSWWAGGVVGAGLGGILGVIFGFIFIGLAAVGVLAILGLLLDRAVSKNYATRKISGVGPSWWAGGFGGRSGSGGGGGFGGFSGGSFGGGGSSGSW